MRGKSQKSLFLVLDLHGQVLEGQFPDLNKRFCKCSKSEKNDGSRYGWKGSLLAVHVDVPLGTVELHVKTAAVARAVNLELELLPLVSVGMTPL